MIDAASVSGSGGGDGESGGSVAGVAALIAALMIASAALLRAGGMGCGSDSIMGWIMTAQNPNNFIIAMIGDVLTISTSSEVADGWTMLSSVDSGLGCPEDGFR